MTVMVNTAWHYVTVGLTCLTLMLHVCSVYTLSNNTCFSPQRRRTYCDVYITNTFKDFQVFLMNLQPCFRLNGETFPVSLAVFPIWPRTHWHSPLFVSLTGVFRLWLTSQSRRLWGTTWWMHSNANITARDATVVFFFCLSLSRAPHLCHLFLCFFTSLPQCLFQCCTRLFVEKTKKEKMLSFLFVFLFCLLFSVRFFVFMHLICHEAIHSRSLCLLPLSSLFFPPLPILW